MSPSASRFRHDLRTPLNHIIGYGEILTETLEDEGVSDKEPVFIALTEVLVRARETVRLLETCSDDQLAEQAREAVHRAELVAGIDRLSPLFNSRFTDDVLRMRSAAIRLNELADGNSGQGQQGLAATPRAAVSAAARLLVVDDDSDNRELFRRMLERQGYAVTIAASGPECLEMLAAQSFDLVLLE